jgi:hypothetical protein
MNVIVVSNIATGSSAFLDLLSEYKTVKFALRNTYEHVILYAPYGLFHLRDSIFGPSADQASIDISFRDFKNMMDHYYEKDFGWFAGYKKLIGEPFKKAYMDFLHEVADFTNDNNIAKYKGVIFDPLKAAAQIALKKKNNVYGQHYIIEKSQSYQLKVDQKTFDEAAGRFIEKYISFCESKAPVTIYDHLMWLKDMKTWGERLPKDAKVIYCERDPRDIYCFYKHHYKYTDNYPLDKDRFCAYFAEQREYIPADDDRFHTFQLEDLVLHYDETVKKVEEFVGLDPKDHIDIKKNFNPAISIRNTGLYLRDPSYQEETEYIAKKLSKFLYTIPEEDIPLVKTALDKPW